MRTPQGKCFRREAALGLHSAELNVNAVSFSRPKIDAYFGRRCPGCLRVLVNSVTSPDEYLDSIFTCPWQQNPYLVAMYIFPSARLSTTP
jgi:hypothetical protein